MNLIFLLLTWRTRSVTVLFKSLLVTCGSKMFKKLCFYKWTGSNVQRVQLMQWSFSEIICILDLPHLIIIYQINYVAYGVSVPNIFNVKLISEFEINILLGILNKIIISIFLKSHKVIKTLILLIISNVSFILVCQLC